MDFRRSRRQAFTMRKLGAAEQPTKAIPQTTPCSIAQILKANSFPHIPKCILVCEGEICFYCTKSNVRKEMGQFLENSSYTSVIVEPISASEVNRGQSKT